MSNPINQVDEKKGDDVLKRMLKTPPKKEESEGQSPRSPALNEDDKKD